MPEFKTKLLDNKVKRRSTKSSSTSRKPKFIYIVAFLFVLSVIVTVVIFILFGRSSSPPKKQSQNKDARTTERTISSEDHVVYYTKLRNYIKELDTRLFKSSEEQFIEDFMIFTALTNPGMISRLHVVYHSTLNLKLHSIDYYKMFEQKEEQTVLEAIYFGKLFVYYKIINTSFGAFQRLELDKVIKMENEREVNKDYNTFMFLYQQHYISNIVEAMGNILETNKEAFLNEFKIIFNDVTSYKVLKVVLDALLGLEKSLFTEVNTTIKFIENKEDLKIKYILTSTKIYKKFLILSFYLIFLHIFEVNESFDVIDIREELKSKVNERIVESGVMDKESFTGPYRDGFLKNCSGLFKNVMEFEDNLESSIFEIFGKTFKDCINSRVFTT